MPRYALLIAPSTNRVYADASLHLTRAELSIFGSTVLSKAPEEIAEERIGGVPYVVFDGELTAVRIRHVRDQQCSIRRCRRHDPIIAADFGITWVAEVGIAAAARGAPRGTRPRRRAKHIESLGTRIAG